MGEEFACLSTRGRWSKRRVHGRCKKTDATKTLQSKHNNNLLSFRLHFIITFVVTNPKLAHGPVKFPARLISHFVMNIIMAKTGLTTKVNSAKWHIFSNPPKYLGLDLTPRRHVSVWKLVQDYPSVSNPLGNSAAIVDETTMLAIPPNLTSLICVHQRWAMLSSSQTAMIFSASAVPTLLNLHRRRRLLVKFLWEVSRYLILCFCAQLQHEHHVRCQYMK